jgi:hypothetical protein
MVFPPTHDREAEDRRDRVKTTRLKKGAKVFARILTSGELPNGRVLDPETLRLLQIKLGDEYILFDEEDGRVSLLGTVEVGKVKDPGHLLVRSSTSVGEGGSFMTGTGTSGPITCEWCGTEWNEDADPDDGGGEDVGFVVFNGIQVVRECCGKLFDVLFSELGRRFFEKYLQRLVDDPFANPWETRQIFEAAKKVRDKGADLVGQADDALDGIKFTHKDKPF